MELKVPEKGFTKAERIWIRELIEVIRTVRGVQGRHVTISNTADGQVINADECDPCP